ncbi:D-alanine--D-alanine ligase [soil metagenome]
MALRVLHLVGSPVSELLCDLSRLYARDCLASTADPLRRESVIAYVTPDGWWRFPDDLEPEAILAAPAMHLPAAIEHITDLDVDVALPQMFCPPGMTHYRALLDVLEIPYLGNAPDVMALTMNKDRARTVVRAAGVAVPDGELLKRGDQPTIEVPAVVKPVDVDNSLGVTFVDRADGFAPALSAAFAHSDEVLVERYVPLGREVRCGIVVIDGELVCLPLEEYDLDEATKPIRGLDDKLARTDDGELELVAKTASRAWIVDVDDGVTEAVWRAARACHVALGCRHYSLFDFRIDPDGTPWFLEAGLYCSFARQSVIATMAAATGIDTASLLEIGLRDVLVDHLPVVD